MADTPSADLVAAFPSSFLAGGPGVATVAATSIGPFGAALRGQVDPAGHATVARFDVAPSSSAFCLSSGTGAPAITTGDITVGSGAQSVPVEAAVASLLPLTGYCFRVAAANDRAESVAGPLTFATAAPSMPSNPGGVPEGGGGVAPSDARPASPPAVAAPFGALSVARVQSAKTFRTVTFAASVGRARSVILATIRYRGEMIGRLRLEGGPGTVRGRISIGARGRKLLRRARRAALHLTVTVTPPGGKPIAKGATISLTRGKASCSPASSVRAPC